MAHTGAEVKNLPQGGLGLCNKHISNYISYILFLHNLSTLIIYNKNKSIIIKRKKVYIEFSHSFYKIKEFKIYLYGKK
jgi:hypothetical protein